MGFYEEKKQMRLERYEELAEKKEKEASRLFERARELQSVIPLGQPMMTDHYSYKSDKSFRNKINKTYEKSFRTAETAEYYKEKVENAKYNNTIQSTDDNAIEKLEAKVKQLSDFQTLMRDVNKLIRKHSKKNTDPIQDIINLGVSEAEAREIMTPNCYNGVGFMRFELSNNNARLKTAKERLEGLKKLKERAEINIVLENGILIREANQQIQVVFAGKPNQEVRNTIKRYPHSLKWSRFSQAWVRKMTTSITNRYIRNLVDYLKTLDKEAIYEN